MSDAWPSPDSPSGPLPRIEDLPIAEQGYDQESVRLAFDSFYRHAAQLDASLRALEAVEVFRRDADALRNDLRALRTLGLGFGAAEPAWSSPRYEPVRRELPTVVLRLAAESAFIVAVAVIAGIASFRPAVVVALMAAAFVIVALSEWLAARGRFVPPAAAFLSHGEPAPYVEAPVPGWGPAAEPDEETEPEALTIVASPEEVEAAAAAPDPWEAGLVVHGVEVHGVEVHGVEVHGVDADGVDADGVDGHGLDAHGLDAEPELADRGGLFRRRRR
jgi:hypothetical protein